MCGVSDIAGPVQSGYGERERVFTDAPASYDAERGAAAARAHDPGLPEETALDLAAHAEEHLRAMDSLDAPELARRLLAGHSAAGATPAAVVAKAALDCCTEHGISP